MIVKNYSATVSPLWRIHAGSGTTNNGFIFGMAGENMAYPDMDVV